MTWVRGFWSSWTGIGLSRESCRSSAIQEASSLYGAIRMTVSDTDWRILVNTDGMILNGGKAYTVPIRLHGIDRMSMKAAHGSGNGDTNLGHFLLANVANKSIHRRPQRLNTGCNRSGWISHSVGSICPGCDSLSAWMLFRTGRWTGIITIRLRLQNFNSLMVNRVSLNDLVLPTLPAWCTTPPWRRTSSGPHGRVSCWWNLWRHIKPPPFQEYWCGSDAKLRTTGHWNCGPAIELPIHE